MSLEYREHTLALLREEPTRSLPLGELRRRLAAGSAPLPGVNALAEELAGDPRFRVLAPGMEVCELPAEYAATVGITGVAVEVRVVLAQGEEEERGPAPLAGTRAALLGALARDAALQARVSAALGQLEEIGSQLPWEREVRDGAAAPTTTPLPVLPAGVRSRRRWQRRP